LTQDRILAAVEESMFGMDSPGFCVACGEDAMYVEPDARRYPCELCEERAVYGAEELLLETVA
jgi:hypothetical protein